MVHSRSIALGAAVVVLALHALGDDAYAGEDTRFTKQSTALFDGPGGKILGSLPPAVPVQVVQTAGRRTQVVIEGWSAEYHDLEVFAGWDLRMERVTLVRMKAGVREVIGKKTDSWDINWSQVRITGWVDSRALTKNLDDVWREAKDIHTTRCTVCHPFKAPDLLTASQWRGTLVIMAHRAALTPEETALIRQYLQTNARAPVIMD